MIKDRGECPKGVVERVICEGMWIGVGEERLCVVPAKEKVVVGTTVVKGT